MKPFSLVGSAMLLLALVGTGVWTSFGTEETTPAPWEKALNDGTVVRLHSRRPKTESPKAAPIIQQVDYVVPPPPADIPRLPPPRFPTGQPVSR